MSYRLKVLAENPLGYWSFSGSNNDLTINSNNATLTSASFIEPPIIANSGSALKIGPSSSVSITNNYSIFGKNFENSTFTIAFWFDFGKGFTGSGYGSNPFINNKLEVIDIRSGSTQVGKIYYDYELNTIRFSMNGSGNTDAYYVIRDFDTQYYVVATYSKKGLFLTVNNFAGISGYVSDTSIISAQTSSSVKYVIHGGSLNSGDYFLLNELAVFDKPLSSNKINIHMAWALEDGYPINYSNYNSKYNFTDFKEVQSYIPLSQTVEGLDFGKYGNTYNLNVGTSGLTSKVLNNLVFTSFSGSPSYSISSSSGISWTGIAGVDFLEFNKYFAGNNSVISVQRNSSATHDEYIFSLSNVNGNKTLYYIHEATSSSLCSLYLYDPATSSSTFLTSTVTTASPGLSTLGLILNQDKLLIYSSQTGESFFLSNNIVGIIPLSTSSKSVLTLGNSYHSPSATYSSFKNFGITDSKTNTLINFDPTKVQTFMAKLTNSADPFVVSQYGSWRFIIPLSTVSTLAGTYLDWSSMDNCQVLTSIDNGDTFYNMNRNSSIYEISSSTVPDHVLVRVDIFSDKKQETQQQSFQSFKYGVYSNLDQNKIEYSYSGLVHPSFDNVVYKNNGLQILSNPSNFGAKFSGNYYPSYMYANSASGNYYALDFWYRSDADISGKEANIISNDGGRSVEPYVWIDNSGKLQYTGSSMYVNGVLAAASTVNINSGTPYHISLVLSNTASSVMYLNADPSTASTILANATFGFMSIWKEKPTASDILEKYQLFTGPKTVVINDNYTTKIIPNIGSGLEDSVSTFKIG